MKRVWLLVVLLWAVPSVAQGSVLLVGGGTPPPDAAAWLTDRAPNGRVIVLDYTDDPDTAWMGRFRAAGAAVTYRAVSARDARDPAVAALVRSHDGVFLPGGDQNRYVTQWTGTAVADAVRDVFGAGGAVGGTSAGAMVLGGTVYDARTGGASARSALRDAGGPDLALSPGFLPLVPTAVVETHLSERGRLVRLLAFVARAHAQGLPADGIGVDDGTALGIAPDGTAEVLGSGVVAFARLAGGASMDVQSRVPLGVGPMRLVQVVRGARIDLATLAEIVPPGGAHPFTSTPLVLPTGPVILDGSASVTQSAINAFDAAAAPGPVLLLGTDDGLRARIKEAGRAVVMRDLTPLSAQSATLAGEVRAAGSVAVSGLAPNGAALLAATAVGDALREHATAGGAVLAVGESVQALGEVVLLGLGNDGASDQGTLSLGAASGVLGGVAALPLAYGTDRDDRENRSAGWIWSVIEGGASLGFLIPDGAVAALSQGTLTASGEAPVLLLDLRGVASVGAPTVRQNAHFVEARVWVVAPGQSVSLGDSR